LLFIREKISVMDAWMSRQYDSRLIGDFA